MSDVQTVTGSTWQNPLPNALGTDMSIIFNSLTQWLQQPSFPYGINIGNTAIANGTTPADGVADPTTFWGGVSSPTYCAHVYRSAAWTNPGGLWACPWDTALHDIHGMFNASTHMVVAPVTGFYLVSGAVGILSGAASQGTQGVVFANTSEAANGTATGGEAYYGAQTISTGASQEIPSMFNFALRVAAGGSITAGGSGGAGVAIQPGNGRSYMTVTYLGPEAS